MLVHPSTLLCLQRTSILKADQDNISGISLLHLLLGKADYIGFRSACKQTCKTITTRLIMTDRKKQNEKRRQSSVTLLKGGFLHTYQAYACHTQSHRLHFHAHKDPPVARHVKVLGPMVQSCHFESNPLQTLGQLERVIDRHAPINAGHNVGTSQRAIGEVNHSHKTITRGQHILIPGWR